MQKRLRILYIIVSIVLSINLFACDKVSKYVVIKEESKISDEKEDIKNDNVVEEEIGDELVELKGFVPTKSKYQLPELDSELFGFKVKAIYDYSMKNAKVVLFEHEKTGAKAFLISNDDEDKMAALGFNTLTYDNKGIPHVFEHACLGGSEKYPNANLFTEAVNRTYNTFINALTMQHATVYPIASLSDEQLFELYKFYLDGVFNPNILRDQKNLDSEAYRYTLYDKRDDIKLNGVVYSEMAGNEGNIEDAAYRNSLNTMFNNSYMGANTGGETDYIPEITHKDLIDFHEKYYHPSNMILTLYGDIDYKKYLKYADEEYLNKYDKKVIDKGDPDYHKREGFSIVKYDFPLASDSEIEGKTVINYNVVCEGMTSYESGIFELILRALERSDGPINTRLLDRLPNATFYVMNNLYMPRPNFTLTFNNVNESDNKVIQEIVEESFKELIEKGISEDTLTDILNYFEWEIESSKDSHGFTSQTILFFARAFSTNGEDTLGFFRHDKAMEELEATYKNGTVKRLINTYLSADDNFSMDMTVPKRGLLEENSEKLKNKLKKMKDGLNDEELKELINKTKEFDAWIEEQAKNSIIDVLRVATISELNEYRAKCYVYEENIEGINFIRSEIEDCKYNYYNLLFDIGNLDIKDAMKLKFLSSLLLELPTTNYDGQKLKAELDKYTISNDVSIYINEYYNGGYKPYFAFSCTSLDRNLDKAFELMKELMNETKFDDIEKVRNIVSSNLNFYKNYASTMPDMIAENILMAKTNEDSLYEYNISGVNYINFLKKISAMSDDELREFLAECEKIYNGIYNSYGFYCEIIGNFDTIKEIKTKVLDLSKTFKRERIISKTATFSELRDKTAIVSTGTMNYNYIAMPMIKDNIKYSGKYAVLGKIVDDKLLYPEFRVKRSAYGAYTSFNRVNAFVYTYRDPNLKESYKVFNNLPSLMKGIKLTDEELDDYKLSAYADFAYPMTKLGAAQTAVAEAFSKVDEKRPDRFVRYMREIKDMTLDDIKEFGKVFDEMIKRGIQVSVGSKEAIEENANMFDEIIYDYVR